MKKLNIGYFADGPWSHRAFDLLVKDESIKIQFIVPRKDTSDATLKNYASHNNIDYLFPVKINSQEFITEVKKYNCDLFVSMSFNQIFKIEVLSIPAMGTINCHAGKLPFYRGRNILNWALINDEKEFGITVHFIDEGIDTGDIIKQKTYPITDSDTYKTLLEVAHTECAAVLFDSVKAVQNGNFTRKKQTEIDSVGSYCNVRGVGDEIIDWNQNSRKLFNFIRAVCKPAPMATAFKNGKEVKINKSRPVKDSGTHKGNSGQLVLKTDLGFLVKTNDSVIEILEIETSEKLAVGDTLTGK